MSKKEEAGIATPHEHDVLSGRGNFVNYHPGNEHFRGLVRKHKLAYVQCPKPQKGKFSRIIYDEIKARDPPGRFLKQDPTSKLWYDIGEKKAMDKARQALREGAPEIIKEISGDDEKEGGAAATTGATSSSGFESQVRGFQYNFYVMSHLWILPLPNFLLFELMSFLRLVSIPLNSLSFVMSMLMIDSTTLNSSTIYATN